MIPAVDESVLRDNPDFAALYRTLTTVILNPDGSTKNEALKKERDAVRQQLAEHRHAHARDHLLINAIATATPEAKPKRARSIVQPRSSRPSAPSTTKPEPANTGNTPPAETETVPDDLLDLLLLLPPLLTAEQPLDKASLDLLFSTPPFSELPTLLPQLAPILSSSLHASAAALARISSPSTNPSFLHRRAATLAPTITAKREEIRTAEADIVSLRLRIADDTAALLAKYRLATGLLIKSLEGKHGVVARSLELRATEAGLLARKGHVDAYAARDAVKAEIYPPEAIRALENYTAHLRDARVRTEEAIRALEGKLEGYGVGVEGGEGKEARMREMARAWQEMERELEDVTRDMERLGRA